MDCRRFAPPDICPWTMSPDSFPPPPDKSLTRTKPCRAFTAGKERIM